ncbi:MAG TPA: LysE family translocator [Rudaea sp.]|jgi:threonine/homoserine/homoserine lactone efflux protein|nr:LysE family translocator [Rudaea sp.]
MHLQTLLAFAAVAAMAILSPGPAVLLSLRNGATLGARSVAWSALGNISGVTCLSAAAMLGLGVVLKSSVLLFGIVKLAGAAYLFYVGWRHLRGQAVLVAETDPQRRAAAPRAAALYREGFLIAATNPKAVLFFTALFPQFVDATQPVMPQFLILTGVFVAISYIAHLGYATVAARAKGVLVGPFFAKWLNRIVGTAFMTFGALLLTLRRQSV